MMCVGRRLGHQRSVRSSTVTLVIKILEIFVTSCKFSCMVYCVVKVGIQE